MKTIQDTRREPAAEVRLTAEQVSSIEAAEAAIAADERFEHLVPDEDLILMFAADCAVDRKAGHAKAFMESHGREAVERACYFGVESLSVEQAAEVAGVRLLPLDAPEIPR